MKFCPVTRELCKESMIIKLEAKYCVYGGIYKPFKDMKECPKNNNQTTTPAPPYQGGEL
jgi:hypothetical protein